MKCEKFGCKRNWSWLGFGLDKFGGLAFFALVGKLVNKWSYGFCAILVGNCHKCICSVRLTWDVFVRDLDCQLETPSHLLPVDSCKRGQKGALVAVCTLTLKSASKKHQKIMHLRIGAPWRVLWRWLNELCLVYIFSFWQRSFPSPLCVTSRLKQATREFLENLQKVRTPFPTFAALFKLP